MNLKKQFSEFDKNWKVDDFPDYVKLKKDICSKCNSAVDVTIQVDFGKTSVGVGDARLIGNLKADETSWELVGGHISVDDNYYDFNNGSRPPLSELLTRIGGSIPGGKDYWVRIFGKRDVTDSGTCP